MNNSYQLDRMFIGMFLQFKVVKRMTSITKNTPSSIKNRPHYRVSLDTTKNLKTGFSQHELLFALNKNQGAFVYYACPMIFERSSLYEVNVDLNALRLTDISTCPTAYKDNDNHFIFFGDTAGDPVWCSDPIEGNAIDPKEFVRKLVAYAQEVEPRTAALNLLKMLQNTEAIPAIGKMEIFGSEKNPSILPFVSDSLMIISVPISNTKRA